MLHQKGGDSHDGQAIVTPPGISLPGLFDTSRYRNALAALLQPSYTRLTFWQRLLYKCGFAQVGFGIL